MFFMLFCIFQFFIGVSAFNGFSDRHLEDNRNLNPILCNLQRTTGGYWLLDSGAAATVVSHETYERFRAAGQTSSLKPSTQSFYAANGSSVVVAGETQLQGYVLATAHGNTQPVSMSLTAVVGSTQHDIMSTNQCVARGWTFAFSQEASCMKHEASGLAVNEITSWGGCPWVVFTPTISELSAVLAKPAPQLSDRLLQPISQVPRVSSDVTAQHHEPLMSPISKVALTADFMFVEDHKVLVFHERSTGCIGAVVMTGDVARDRNVFCKWLTEMGISSTGGIAIQLATDAEPAVAAFITSASESMQWLVEKAPPQGHEFVGAAERSVRTCKEGISVIRSELADQNLGLNLTPQSLSDILRFVIRRICFRMHMAVIGLRRSEGVGIRFKIEGANVCSVFGQGSCRDP